MRALSLLALAALALVQSKPLNEKRATFAAVRPPAVPLAVRSPYLSTWSDSNTLVGSWPKFWTGSIKGWAAIARVDGLAYPIMGDPGQDPIGSTGNAVQKSLTVTPTKSIYVMQAGAVEVTLTFLSPIEPDSTQLQSIPLSYLQIQARSTDGALHIVQIMVDISAEWANGDSSKVASWAVDSSVSVTGGNLQSFTVQTQSPTQFSETGDYPNWGTVVWSTLNANSLSWQSGDNAPTMRAAFVSNGRLSNLNNANFRAINNGWPIFAFSNNLNYVSSSPSQTLTYVIGHVRPQAITWQRSPVNAYWTNFWSNWQGMLQFFYNDLANAVSRSNALDNKIADAANAANGPNYEAIVALAARQAFGGVELVGSTSEPWLMLKEISSNGNMQTVDVIYPAAPILYYLNGDLIRLILNPHINYMSSGLWPRSYATHDLGSSYPNADGHNDGGGEEMPVEESANMLILVGMYLQNPTSQSDAKAWATTHYNLFRGWAEFLVANTLYPDHQLTTDDFAGPISNATNLALKGIIGLGEMGRIANFVGKTGDALRYSSVAKQYTATWDAVSRDASGQYLNLAYGNTSTWSLKYNLFPDKLLGLNLIPANTIALEDAKYKTVMNTYGVPLDVRHTYTKVDWELWTAASANDASLRQSIVDGVYRFINTSPSRVPFSDWYDTVNGGANGFRARPVIGGMFSILAQGLNKPGLPEAKPSSVDTSKTYRITVGGRSGCYNVLSVAACGSAKVDLFGSDEGSGRQRFKFVPVDGLTNVYNIKVAGGRDGCDTFLSSGQCGSNLVDLYSRDDGSGRQRWVVNPSGNGFNIQPYSGRASCNTFLSVASCGTDLVDLYSFDDASGRQQFTLTAV
ncbi:Ricin B-type lectin domain-containing protein [Mycena indigotica]|uniref:Ricin B-type lectin domain-containing protein n=1 Tax=Mycena indigotica TaxID=2126181 RepID=A0A8H6SVZ0_9AGAR|nr:Ricin B-type lectin domain-containing protein [Mycena indigotica]KAF7306293.1 Ricin B-type lectin domain-containing protein [Mycena indigotica]